MDSPVSPQHQLSVLSTVGRSISDIEVATPGAHAQPDLEITAHNRQYLAPKSWNPENPRALNMCRYVRAVGAGVPETSYKGFWRYSGPQLKVSIVRTGSVAVRPAATDRGG